MLRMGSRGGTEEEGRWRGEGTEEGAKKVARAAGGKAAGAWVIGGCMRWKKACYGGRMLWKGTALWRGGKT